MPYSRRGGNIHVAADGNFSHCHNKSAGGSPTIDYEPLFFIPKDFVDAVGHAHDQVRKGPRRPYVGDVPEEAIQQCEDSHKSGDGHRKRKVQGNQHDDTGIMALVCRHDIPLFACNIDTPGEQQKYVLALLIWLMLHLPDGTTVGALYDVGCVTNHILELVRVSSDNMMFYSTIRSTICLAQK